ncbi:MAG TPA: sialidase family protein, partial [Gaiellaceae bacterium]|nr:sialidase family protein [Gaiellaceae bacterium]
DLVVPFYDEDRVAAVRSTDGGRSFSAPVTVAPTRFKPTPGLRAPPLPSAEVGGDGTVHLAWPDCGPSCARNDVVVASSSDGITWSAPRRVPLGRGADFVLPGLGADPSRPGRLALAYYASRPGGVLDVGFVASRDGGRTWSSPRRLNAQTIRYEWIAQAGGAMLADYISTSWAGPRAVSAVVLASPPGGALDQALFAVSIRP